MVLYLTQNYCTQYHNVNFLYVGEIAFDCVLSQLMPDILFIMVVMVLLYRDVEYQDVDDIMADNTKSGLHKSKGSSRVNSRQNSIGSSTDSKSNSRRNSLDNTE